MPSPSLRIAGVPVLLLVFAAMLAQSPSGSAQAFDASHVSAASPVGRWKTVDDHTGKVRSIVTVREENGKLYGTIETLIDPPVPHPTCYLCSGDLKDRPLVGLQVLWGFTKDGDRWSGGHVLDPESGKIYSGWVALENGGKTLRLHGYVVVSFVGRTVYWQRTE